MRYRSLLALCVIVTLGGCIGQASLEDSIGEIADVLYEIADVICILVVSIFQIAGAIGALIIVFAGVKWAGSHDNPAERKAAKDMIVAVIVGLVIIYIAAALVSTVMQQSFECDASGFVWL